MGPQSGMIGHLDGDGARGRDVGEMRSVLPATVFHAMVKATSVAGKGSVQHRRTGAGWHWRGGVGKGHVGPRWKEVS